MDKNELAVSAEGNRDREAGAGGYSEAAVMHVPRLVEGNCPDELVCRVEGCPGECAARGLCWKHYMRERRYGSVSFRKRRYNLPPACRYCGTTDARAFYRQYKSVCKHCKKLRAVIQQMNGEVAESSSGKTIK